MTDLEQMVVEAEHRFAAAPEQVFALLSDVEAMAGLGPAAIAARAAGLRASMLAVLAAADELLSPAR